MENKKREISNILVQDILSTLQDRLNKNHSDNAESCSFVFYFLICSVIVSMYYFIGVPYIYKIVIENALIFTLYNLLVWCRIYCYFCRLPQKFLAELHKQTDSEFHECHSMLALYEIASEPRRTFFIVVELKLELEQSLSQKSAGVFRWRH